MFPQQNTFNLLIFVYDVNGLYHMQLDLYSQCDNNIPACFVFPLQKIWIMLKELFSL